MEVVGAVASTYAIVGAAATGLKIANQIKEFIADVKNVDETVKEFQNEVQTVCNSLKSIEESFTRIEPLIREKEHVKGIWASVETTGQDCLRTAERLLSLLQQFKNNSRGTYDAVVKQLKLKSRGDKIAEYRRQLALYNSAFQTQIVSITLCILCHDQNLVSRRTIEIATEVVLAQLADERFLLISNLGRLREDRQGNISLHDDQDAEAHIIRSLEECSDAALHVYDAGSAELEQLSSMGSQNTTSFTTRDRRRIYEWIQERSVAGSVVGDLGSDAAEAAIFDGIAPTSNGPADSPHAPSRGPATTSTGAVHNEVRSDLIHRGLIEYKRGLYKAASDCFSEALDFSTGTAPPVVAGGNIFSPKMDDHTLRLWLALAESRLIHHSQQSHEEANQNLANLARRTGIDLQLLSRALPNQFEAAQGCLNACQLAQILLHVGAITRAESICHLAMRGLERCKAISSLEYQESQMVMAEILYSKGPTQAAQILCERIYVKALRKSLEPILSTGSSSGDISTTTGFRIPESVAILKDAAMRGNFRAALYVLRFHRNPALKVSTRNLPFTPHGGDGRTDYLTDALSSNSLATISLLVQHREMLEDYGDHLLLSRVGVRQDPISVRMMINKFLYESIATNYPSAADLLLRHGSDINASQGPEEFSKVGPSTCYVIDRHARMSPLAYGLAQGHEMICLVLLRAGAVVDGKSQEFPCNAEEPPLNMAIRSLRSRHLVGLLLTNGANVNIKYQGVRPLAVAIYYSGKAHGTQLSPAEGKTVSRREIVEMLIRKGADVNKTSIIKGQVVTPLQQATDAGLKSICDILIKAGATQVIKKHKSSWWKRR